MLVTFARRWRSYNAGESALFDAAVAAELVAGGFAVPARTEATEPTEPTEATEATEPTEPSEPPAPKGKQGK